MKLGFMKLGLGSSSPPTGNNTSVDTADTPDQRRTQNKLGKILRKREQSYRQAHDQLADSIEIRNKAQSKLTEGGVNKGTQSEALEQVGLSQAKNFVGDNRLATGFIDGFSAQKAQIKGITPQQYAQPSPKAHIVAGGEVLGMTPTVIRGVNAQHQVVQKSTRFQGERLRLKDARMTNLTAQQGDLRKQKHGKIVSGSYQASSPEELAASLNRIQPASNIRDEHIGLYIPNEAGLLPRSAPKHLPPPQISSPEKKHSDPTLTPQQATEKMLAQRDTKITSLDQSLRKQDSVALERAIQNRDYYQLQTSGDLVKGLAQTPRDSAILGLNYLYQYVPKGPGATPLFSAQTIQQAENRVGYAVGQQMADSKTAKPMLRQQVEVEKLHQQGQPIATELRDLHKEKALETDRKMIVDQDGERFYDAFESPIQMRIADVRYEAMAREKLPRPTDQLYLNNAVTRFVPNQPGEIIRRPLNGWLNPPTTP